MNQRSSFLSCILPELFLLLLFATPKLFAQQELPFQQLWYDNSNDVLNTGSKIYKGSDSSKSRYTRLRLTGDSLVKLSCDVEAIWWYEKAATVFPQSAPLKDKIRLYNNIGIAYQHTKDYEQALKYYYKGLHLIGTKEKGSAMEAACYVNIGIIHALTGNYDRFISFHRKALPIYVSNGNHQMAANAMLGIGGGYFTQKNYDTARHFYYLALQHLDSVEYVPEKPKDEKESLPYASPTKESVPAARYRLLVNIAKTWLDQNQPDSAINWLDKAMRLGQSIPAWYSAFVYVNYADAYGQKANYAEAIAHLNKGLMVIKTNTAQNARLTDLRQDYYKHLSRFYAKMGKYRQAWDYENLYSEDLVKYYTSNENNLRLINNLETKYRLAEKDKLLAKKELSLLKSNSRLKIRNLQAVLLILCAASAGIILFVSIRSHRNKQGLLREQLHSSDKNKKIMQVEATLQGVETERERIAKELHDSLVGEVLALKLNLRTVKDEFPALKNSTDYSNIISQSQMIADKLRQTAHNLMPAKLEELGIYASVQAFLERINCHHLHFNLQHYGELPRLQPDVEKIILLAILELIQNVLKHARATQALVQLNVDGDILSITVEDNGVGIPSTPPTGMGLTNLQKNLGVLNAKIDIHSTEYTGTTILIEIPIEEYRIDDIPKKIIV